MKESLKKIMTDGMASYSKTSRVDWVLDWPGQVVLTVNLIYWTIQVTEVKKYFEQVKQFI